MLSTVSVITHSLLITCSDVSQGHLEVLNISGNNLESLSDLEILRSLTQLFAADNQLNDMRELSQLLAAWPRLWRLELVGNPLCHKPKYKDRIIVMCRQLGMCVRLWVDCSNLFPCTDLVNVFPSLLAFLFPTFSIPLQLCAAIVYCCITMFIVLGMLSWCAWTWKSSKCFKFSFSSLCQCVCLCAHVFVWVLCVCVCVCVCVCARACDPVD